MATQLAAIGFAPHSGWAAMIALGIDRSGPSVLARSRVQLIDDHDPDSKQPYHSVEFLCVEEATGRLTGYMDVAKAMAYAAIKSLAEGLKSQGYCLQRAGILESAGRKTNSLSSILASHALIHAADGDHFRNALWAAAGQYGLEVHRIQARALEEHATARLHLPKQRMLATVNQLGRQIGPPWGADQKRAALLAWSLLKDSRAGS
jgi:hypothetical protein